MGDHLAQGDHQQEFKMRGKISYLYITKPAECALKNFTQKSMREIKSSVLKKNQAYVRHNWHRHNFSILGKSRREEVKVLVWEEDLQVGDHPWSCRLPKVPPHKVARYAREPPQERDPVGTRKRQ